MLNSSPIVLKINTKLFMVAYEVLCYVAFTTFSSCVYPFSPFLPYLLATPNSFHLSNAQFFSISESFHFCFFLLLCSFLHLHQLLAYLILFLLWSQLNTTKISFQHPSTKKSNLIYSFIIPWYCFYVFIYPIAWFPL